MFMNFKNFANELDMLNNIINATEDRAYAVSSAFDLDGYNVILSGTDTDDKLYFVLRSTGDGCAIYPISADYEGQHISFVSEVASFEEMVKLIGNFFCEVDGE